MKNTLSNIKVLFLDFDGVVVESTHIKTDAFYDVYLPYGKKIAEKAKEHHLKHQGVNRSKKFEAIHQLFLNKSCPSEEREQLSQQFSEIVFEKILKAPLVEGVIDFLEKMKAHNIPTFLLSATPHEELIKICQEKHLSHYFKGIYGSPYEKSEIGTKLIHQYGFKRKDIFFIGDSISDFNAASKIDVNFIGRVAKGEANPFELSIPIIQDFRDFL
ncbi:MAG: HAD family hydrolase [Proteobacteria bacterium]|nr:HAD family hydrolase [Pseudomonadota bacterium]